MNVLLKGLLLVALVLLVSTKAQRSYESLDSKYKIHVDKALEKVNTGNLGSNHFNFYLIQEPLRLLDNYYVNIILRSTECKKKRGNHEHREECRESVNRRFIDCVVCKTDNGELVDCAFLKDVKKAKPTERAKCKYNFGGQSLLLQTGNSEKEFGCLGCI